MKKKSISLKKETFDRMVSFQREHYPKATTYSELLSAMIDDLSADQQPTDRLSMKPDANDDDAMKPALDPRPSLLDCPQCRGR